MLDYIVVGLGLAGAAFCETLKKNKKNFLVISDDSQTSSKVAGGLSNPVILKRFTLAWKADMLMPISRKFYEELEKELNNDLIVDQPILRKFSSSEEQNLWFEASDKIFLRDYLSSELVRNNNKALNAPFDFGKLNGAYRLKTETFLNAFRKRLIASGNFINETFDYDDLNVKDDAVSYRNISAKKIVFAEGFGLKKNPYFNYLPMQGSKGEYILIESKELKESKAIKSSVFVIPFDKNLYLVGANYDPKDKDNEPSEDTKQELVGKLNKVVNCSYQVVGQVAGVRPTVKDRRPLMGSHPKYPHLSVLNGFGSHGVMIAPWAAQELFSYLEEEKKLITEVDIQRFSSLQEN